MTPQELKNSILQLAIQGKLVEQRAEEGTAAEKKAAEKKKKAEAWGGGVSRYFTACAASGLPPPTVTEEAGFFKVVFWRQTKGAGAFDDASTTPVKTTAETTAIIFVDLHLKAD